MIRATRTASGDLRFEVWAGEPLAIIGYADTLQAAAMLDGGFRREAPRQPPTDDAIAELVDRGRSLDDRDTAALCDWVTEAADAIEALQWVRFGLVCTIENLRAEIANAREHRP